MQPIPSIPNILEDRQRQQIRHDKRAEVIDQARKLLSGKPVVIRKGDHVLCFDDILQIAIKHHGFAALMKTFSCPENKNGHIIELKEFMVKAANYQVCEYLYPGESQEIGFNF